MIDQRARIARPSAHLPGADRSEAALLAPEGRLEMPEQDLAGEPAQCPAPAAELGEPDLWRVLAIALTLVPMWIAGAACHEVLQVGGYTPLEAVTFILFEVLFGWISYALVLSLIGFVGSSWSEPGPAVLSPDSPLPALAACTAILMPVYNEDPTAVFARLTAMQQSIRELGRGGAFHFFILSDTRDAAIRAREVEHACALRETAGEGQVFYRHRELNHGRKAGNIAEWVRRFGGAYDQMVVLDADSLMAGETLVRLAGAMEANPRLGLLQTAPSLVNRLQPVLAACSSSASRLVRPDADRRPGPAVGLGGQLLGPQRHHPGEAPSPSRAACRP